MFAKNKRIYIIASNNYKIEQRIQENKENKKKI